MTKNEKLFRYTIRTTKGNLIAQEIVAFGNKKNPFPDNWETNHLIQMSLQDYKQIIMNKYLEITIDEKTELDEYPKDK